MLACYKARAVPINVNYRYVADELRYLCDDADLVALFHDADTTEHVNAVDSPPMLLTVIAGSKEYEQLVQSGFSCARPRSAIARRPLRALHRRDDGPAERRGVAPGRHVLRRARQRESRRPADHRAGTDRGVGARQSRAAAATVPPAGRHVGHAVRLARARPADARERAVVGARARCSAAARSCSTANPTSTWSASSICSSASASTRAISSATRARVRCSMRSRPNRSAGTSSLRLLGSGGSIMSGEVKDGLMAAMPSVLAIVEGIGSSESPAQAVAVTTQRRAVGVAHVRGEGRHDRGRRGDVRPVAPGSGVVGRLATRGRVPLGYYKDPERSARTFVEIDGERWSLPGDMATIDADGTVHLLGRGSLCINTGGEKVYPEEVEAVLKTPSRRRRRGRARRARRTLRSARRRDRRPTDERRRAGSRRAADRTAAHLAGYKSPRACTSCRRSRARRPASPTTR